MTFPEGGTEFGGYPGVVQPKPHELKSYEVLNNATQSDPSDPESSELSVAEEHRKAGRDRLNG